MALSAVTCTLNSPSDHTTTWFPFSSSCCFASLLDSDRGNGAPVKTAVRLRSASLGLVEHDKGRYRSRLHLPKRPCPYDPGSGQTGSDSFGRITRHSYKARIRATWTGGQLRGHAKVPPDIYRCIMSRSSTGQAGQFDSQPVPRCSAISANFTQCLACGTRLPRLISAA